MDLMQLLQQRNSPLFQRAIKMTEGKSESEIKEVVLNVAKQKGIDINQLNTMLSQFGYKL